MSRTLSFLRALSLIFFGVSLAAAQEAAPAPLVEAVISVEDQRLVVLKNGALLARYPVSTSKFGVGDSRSSYKTPLGRMQVCEKIGTHLAAGSVLKRRQATGEVLPVNAPGRDPIVTRILWLDGLEAQNANARERSIYIHGTPDEAHIGKPVSWGCIRMRSKDVLALYETLGIGSPVTIISSGLPRYPKYDPASEILLAKKAAPPVPTVAASLAKGTATEAEEISNARAKVALAEAPSPVKVAAAARVAPRPVTTSSVFHSTPLKPASRGGSDLTHRLNSSILLSGLEEPGNSDIPRLGQ